MRPFLSAIGSFLQGEAFFPEHCRLFCACMPPCRVKRIAEKAAELPATTTQARNARVLQLRACIPRCTA